MVVLEIIVVVEVLELEIVGLAAAVELVRRIKRALVLPMVWLLQEEDVLLLRWLPVLERDRKVLQTSTLRDLQHLPSLELQHLPSLEPSNHRPRCLRPALAHVLRSAMSSPVTNHHVYLQDGFLDRQLFLALVPIPVDPSLPHTRPLRTAPRHQELARLPRAPGTAPRHSRRSTAKEFTLTVCSICRLRPQLPTVLPLLLREVLLASVGGSHPRIPVAPDLVHPVLCSRRSTAAHLSRNRGLWLSLPHSARDVDPLLVSVAPLPSPLLLSQPQSLLAPVLAISLTALRSLPRHRSATCPL